MQKIEIRSSAFGEGERIPSDFTCDGADMSPPIEWSGVPARAQSLAIIVDDPDAPSGNWTHWLVYDLPPDLTQLQAGIAAGDDVLHDACFSAVRDGRCDAGMGGG